jgi:hypothetical protein
MEKNHGFDFGFQPRCRYLLGFEQAGKIQAKKPSKPCCYQVSAVDWQGQRGSQDFFIL